jgi:hemolysin III
VLYLVMGWCIVFAGPAAVKALGGAGMAWMLAGGVSYTVGAVFYGIAGHGQKPRRYIHSVFHIFVVIGSILQYIGVILYVI